MGWSGGERAELVYISYVMRIALVVCIASIGALKDKGIAVSGRQKQASVSSRRKLESDKTSGAGVVTRPLDGDDERTNTKKGLKLPPQQQSALCHITTPNAPCPGALIIALIKLIPSNSPRPPLRLTRVPCSPHRHLIGRMICDILILEVKPFLIRSILPDCFALLDLVACRVLILNLLLV